MTRSPAADTPETIHVLVVDDHPLMRTGITAMLNREVDLAVVGEAGDGREAIVRHRELCPTVTLMDLRMPELDGIASIEAIIGECPEARIIVLATYEGDLDIHRALLAGACGYLLKGMVGAEFVSATRAAARGDRLIPAAVSQRLAEHSPRVDLTERGQAVLELVTRYRTNDRPYRAYGRDPHQENPR